MKFIGHTYGWVASCFGWQPFLCLAAAKTYLPQLLIPYLSVKQGSSF